MASEADAIIAVAQNSGGKYDGAQYDTVAAGVVTGNVSAEDFTSALFGKAVAAVHAVPVNAEALAKKATDEYGRDLFQVETTLTSVMVTPDGNITSGTLGDSPLIAFAVKENKVVGATLLNTLDNNDPWHLNQLSATVREYDYKRKFIHAKDGLKTHTVSDLAQEGEKLIIVAASDGVLDSVLQAHPFIRSGLNDEQFADLSYDVKKTMLEQGIAQVAANTQAALKYLSGHIEKAIAEAKEINPQKIADALVNAPAPGFSHDGNGNPLVLRNATPDERDNTSCAVLVIDPNNLPQEPVMAMVADGAARYKEASQAVLKVFLKDSTITEARAMQDNQSVSASQLREGTSFTWRALVDRLRNRGGHNSGHTGP